MVLGVIINESKEFLLILTKQEPFVRSGDYATVKITEAEDFDLYAEPLVEVERPKALHAKRDAKK